MQNVKLPLNQEYPFELPSEEGAVSDFLRESGNTLIIAMPDILKSEAKAMRNGKMKSGILSKNGAIRFLWQFSENGKPVITLDSPFDARIIPDIHLYDVTNNETRLLIDVHIVDSSSRIVRGIRAVTMPQGMTVEFLSAVQDQLASAESSEKQQKTWMSAEPCDLVKLTTMWSMGR